MKKLITICISLVFTVGSLCAQDKDYSEMLPQAGDIALGMDMANFITTFNNSISNSSSTDATKAFRADIFGRYFLSTERSIRAHLAFYMNNYTDRSYITDDAGNIKTPPLGDPNVTELKAVDSHNYKYATTELGVGYEFRRTLRRVQGYAGGEVIVGFSRLNEKFEYGNQMTSVNQTPTTAWSGWGYGNGYRPLESVGGNAWTIGAAAIVGADFFISRNISVGAEFAFEGRYKTTGELSYLTETWMMDKAQKHEELSSPVTTSFYVTPRGSLSLCVYF